MNEFDEAVSLANRILDTPAHDPDSMESVLSRQFLRAVEREAVARELGPCEHPKMFWVSDLPLNTRQFRGDGVEEYCGHCSLCDREKAARAAALRQAASVEFDEPTGCTTFVRTKHSQAAREAILTLITPDHSATPEERKK